MKKQKDEVAVSPCSVGEAGFEVHSPCGRGWFVPLQKVRENYAEFLQQADGLDAAAATEKVAVNEEFVPSWFCEQFNWGDVATLGTLVKEATPEDIARALDFYRNNSGCSPADEVVEHGISKT